MDNAGDRTAKQNLQNGTNENYTYDPIYQLTQVQQTVSGNQNTTESYSYDAVGNRLSSLNVSSYSYNNSNELTSSSDGYSYTYDFNGNTLTKANSSGTTQYAWDFENRLTNVTLPNGGGVVAFKYDFLGMRIQKSGPNGTTNYVYDGNDLIQELDGSGAVLARYARDSRSDETLAMLRGTTLTFYNTDGIDSVTSLTGASTSLIQTYDFDSFGHRTGSGGSVVNSLQYAGRELDDETGLLYLRSRYYVPESGRFLSEDEWRFRATPNFYAYVGNDPVGFADPMGLFAIDKRITLTKAIDIDFACPRNNGGGCTIDVRAKVECKCQCSENGWKADPTLIVTGHMYIGTGPWPYKGRTPVDKSVHDANSAIEHEYGVHINPAIAAVSPYVSRLEAQSFQSEAECKSECKKTSAFVGRLFGAVLADTMKADLPPKSRRDIVDKW